VEWKTLGECIISLKTGLNPRQNFRLDQEDSILPYITGKDIINNGIYPGDKTNKISIEAEKIINKRACIEVGNLLFASTGTGTVGRMAIIKQYNHDWNISETLFNIKPNTEITNSEYLMYVLYSSFAVKQFSPKISKGSVPHLKVKDLLATTIPIPPLSEQHRIVTILDKFEALINGQTASLSAEIKARHQQYEYYRDKLLSCKRKD
jgi:type I restriction enzyme S subunit